MNKLFEFTKNLKYKTVGKHLDYFVVIDDEKKQVRLHFQHTSGKMDWLYNFWFPRKLYKNQQNNIWVHRGWGKMWKSANDEIMEEVHKAREEHKDYELYFCGWSLGAAMVQIAAEDYYFRYKERPTIIGFGCPKPFWGKKTYEYVSTTISEDSQLYNDVNDIVTKMPPFLGWKWSKKPAKVALEKFNFFKLFNPMKYHTGYDKPELYR